jgi:hypothetical protein
MQFFRSTTADRAPKLLHVGRRPPRLAQSTVGDPGSKSGRVAWTTRGILDVVGFDAVTSLRISGLARVAL